MQSPVGAHVVCRSANNKPFYAVVPVCNRCNRAEKVIAYQCTAVTVVDIDAETFHGRISRPNGGFFRTVTGSQRHQGPNRVEVHGTNTAGEPMYGVYNDKDRFIGMLADLALRGLAFGQKVLGRGQHHQPVGVTLNAGVLTTYSRRDTTSFA